MTPWRSLRTLIYLLVGLIAAAALSVGLLLFQTNRETREAFRWASHTQHVIANLDSLVGTLREAESGLRGYLLTGAPAYLQPVDQDMAHATALAAEIRYRVADNPPQEARAARLEGLVLMRLAGMRRGLAHAKLRETGHVSDPALVARSKELMDHVVQLKAVMTSAEETLLTSRTATFEHNAARSRLILGLGGPLLAAMIGAAAWLILSGINRPLDELLAVVRRFGAGDRAARAQSAGRSVEFAALAAAYNQMADRLVEAMERQAGAEREIASANAALIDRGIALESRNRSIALVSSMSQRLQAIRSGEELAEVLSCFLPQALPEVAGSLYTLNSSRNLLARTATWGELTLPPETITPDACWALRRGKAHIVHEHGADLVCNHARGSPPVERRCEPILAGGDVLGLLTVEGVMDEETGFRLGLLTENIALALVNEALRKRLREQSIRDPLTGLFNRRYMEEALALEAARAVRGRSPLAVIMIDVDHFKSFNDRLGHDAGDAVLRSVGQLIQAEFRDGDIVCRFGGEEFLIIAPGAPLDAVRARAEALRLAVRELQVDFRGQRIGPVTMSFGIGATPEGAADQPEELIVLADQALYRAKQLGRDRVESALLGKAASIRQIERIGKRGRAGELLRA